MAPQFIEKSSGQRSAKFSEIRMEGVIYDRALGSCGLAHWLNRLERDLSILAQGEGAAGG